MWFKFQLDLVTLATSSFTVSVLRGIAAQLRGFLSLADILKGGVT